MDTRNNLHSFCYRLYNHVLIIGIHDIDALDLQEKLFLPPFSLQSMFIREMRQTLILIIISIPLEIWHYKRVLLIGIHDIDSLVLQEKLIFPPFSLESKFVSQVVQT